MTPEDLKKHEWIIQQCEAAHFLISPPGYANVHHLQDKLGRSYGMIVAYIEGTYGYFCYRRKELVDLANWMIEQELAHNGWLAEFIDAWKTDERKFFAACDAFASLRELDDRELVLAYSSWFESYSNQWAIALLADAWNLHCEEILVPKLHHALAAQGREAELTRIIPVLTAPVDQSFAAREERALWEILDGIPSDHRHTSEGILAHARDQLEQHARDYHWIRNSYLRVHHLTPADFADILCSMAAKDPKKEIARIDAAPIDAREEKRKLMEDLGFDEQIGTIITFTERMAMWQDRRKHNNLIGDHYLQQFLDELSSRTGWEMEVIRNINCLEYEATLMGRLAKEAIASRTQGFFSIYTYEGIEDITGPLSKHLLAAVKREHDENVADLRGMCACSGRAEGTARIIRETSDIHKMQRGDVLISGMTRPELLPAMKLASAIVTDEGGITSHAAIVSRELGIPCVVGTKVATSVFKDGEMVEVRAEHGLVRRVMVGDRDE